jgi:hypothetical protein
MKFSAIALFCEDIRDEKSEQDTITGILPDNINLPRSSAVLPKLGIYLRFHLNADSEFRTIRARLRVPGADELSLLALDESVLAEMRTNALSSGMPFAGLISKTMFAPFTVGAAGKFEVVAEIDGTDHICGALNVVISQEESATITDVRWPAGSRRSARTRNSCGAIDRGGDADGNGPQPEVLCSDKSRLRHANDEEIVEECHGEKEKAREGGNRRHARTSR